MRKLALRLNSREIAYVITAPPITVILRCYFGRVRRLALALIDGRQPCSIRL